MTNNDKDAFASYLNKFNIQSNMQLKEMKKIENIKEILLKFREIEKPSPENEVNYYISLNLLNNLVIDNTRNLQQE